MLNVAHRHDRQHKVSDSLPMSNAHTSQQAFRDYEDEYTVLRKTLEELNASLDDQQPFASRQQPLSQAHPVQTDTRSRHSSAQSEHQQTDGEHYDDKNWYKQDAAVSSGKAQELHHTDADLQQESSYAQSHRSKPDRRNPDRQHRAGQCLTCLLDILFVGKMLVESETENATKAQALLAILCCLAVCYLKVPFYQVVQQKSTCRAQVCSMSI